MRLSFILLICGIVCFGLKGQTTSSMEAPGYDISKVVTYDSLRTELVLRLNGMMAALIAKDMKQVANYYADNAIIRGPRGIEAKGRAEIDEHWMSLKDKVIDWSLSCEDIFIDEDIIYQTGISTLIVKSANKEYKSLVNYLLIWKRENNDFKIYKDLYHNISK